MIAMLRRGLPWWLAGCALWAPAVAQVGIGTVAVDPSAVLHLATTDRGLLLPRVALGSNPIAGPAEGLLVYNQDAAGQTLAYRTAGAWRELREIGVGTGLTAVNAAGLRTISLVNGTATGQTLVWDNVAGTWTPGTPPGGSQWTTTGSDIYYTTGRVGIGTTTPLTQLQVTGTVAGGLVTGLMQNTAAAVGGMGARWVASAAGVNLVLSAQVNGVEPVGVVGTGSNHAVVFSANAAEAMRIQPGGNVGIGTNNPLSEVVVARTKSGGTVEVIAQNDGTGNSTQTTLGLIANAVKANLYSGTDGGGIGRVGLEVASAHPLVVLTSGLERLRVTAAGNVGIGSTNPTLPLQVERTVNGGGVAIGVANTGTGNSTTAGFTATSGGVVTSYGAGLTSAGVGTGAITVTSNHPLSFLTNSVERMRIGATGQVQLGEPAVTSPGADLALIRNNANADLSVIALANTGTPQVGMYRARTGLTAVQANDLLGELRFRGYDGTNMSGGAYIQATASENFSGSTAASALGFSTTMAGTTSPTQRMVITGPGLVGIGVSNPVALLSVGASSAFQVTGTGDVKSLAWAHGTGQRLLTATATGDVSLGPGHAAGVLTNDGAGVLSWQPAGTLQDLDVTSTVTGTAVSDQSQLTAGASSGPPTEWQSFQAGATGQLTRLRVYVGSGQGMTAQPGTFRIYAGQGNASTPLLTQSWVYAGGGFGMIQDITLTTPVPVTAGSTYTFEVSVPSVSITWIDYNTGNPYALGRAGTNANWDMRFETFVAPVSTVQALNVANGNVVVGGTTGASTLTVDGTLGLRQVNMTASGAIPNAGMITLGGANLNITLPDPATCPGRIYYLADLSNTAHVISSGGGAFIKFPGSGSGPTLNTTPYQHLTLVATTGGLWVAFY